MNIFALALVILTVFVACMAQDAKPVDKPAPHITTEQQVVYFQARADLVEAQSLATDAQRHFNEVAKELQAVCPLVLDANRRPQCAEPKMSEK
jgi:hypothetical protein